jgi:hypothetical protein
MASKLDREGVLARMGINVVPTRVSAIFMASTSFAYPERFSAPLGARKCLSPVKEKLAKYRSPEKGYGNQQVIAKLG